MAADQKIQSKAEEFRAANALGRSGTLRRLFDFLVEHSGDAVAPKEVEIATVLFGSGGDFDVSQDASVRVYIHRLRQKLDEYYRDAGRTGSERLAIPKGVGYRLTLEAAAEPLPALEILPGPSGRARAWLLAAGVALLLLANGLAWVLLRPQPVAVRPDAYAAIRANPVWSSLMADRRPITLVIGDYYIFGEITKPDGASRLVREYFINSASDLDNYLMQNPVMSDRYMDMDLYYLPVSAATALRNIMPVLAPTARDRARIHIVQASDLTPDLIKQTNIVYIGYLSGLGLLKEMVFAGSRFTFGDTYDELIDTNGRHYITQEGGPDPARADQKHKDFGYFSTFTGPNGNKIVVVAGMRDIGVMQTSEAATDVDTLQAMTGQTRASAFEALYEVEGMRRINLGGHLLVVSPLRTDRIWNAQSLPLHFPNG